LLLDYDDQFLECFEGKIRQVFLYVTDRCGLRCAQCLYKTTLANREMDHSLALAFLHDFRSMGAEKLTFIGGEPTLYGRHRQGKPLLELIQHAHDLDYRYIRLDTNGQQNAHLYNEPQFRLLHNLAFSLDGPDAASSDVVRGTRTFERCVRSIRLAVEQGYYTTVTCCVHRGIVDRLPEMIELARQLGIRELNFHPLFKMGIARDGFSGDTDIEPDQWLLAYEQLMNARQAAAPLEIRAPRRFVPTERYRLSPAEYDYCPTLMGERVLIHPDGTLRICALCIGTPLDVGRYEGRRITYTGHVGEFSPQRRDRRPCMSQTRDFGTLTPLCISYKPHQNEYVWVTDRVDDRMLGTGQGADPAAARRI
jgi:MoaA/NifB/PqqE/SkfB family radical SAM enzyme